MQNQAVQDAYPAVKSTRTLSGDIWEQVMVITFKIFEENSISFAYASAKKSCAREKIYQCFMYKKLDNSDLIEGIVEELVPILTKAGSASKANAHSLASSQR